jgi:hypothetical protein
LVLPGKFLFSEAEHHEVAVIPAQGVRERVRRFDTGSAKDHVTVFEAPRLFGRKRDVMRPVAPKVYTVISPLRRVIAGSPSAC